ncbi:uncharacterized protein M421DRAFT_426892 [Didymella exigua CBS 183.55]|uniref:Uncharacterized protein n=1 Tax=Didymella exigua CBS 183.55 TaxID=1150837 RepID=A0A6A5R602_9PLEO|nr:uncharacterized protein M421DRAFT_426892 [Didymella exigua CBS 183.55]KAF1922444.1 hypothetical protein M421DRAFT_426892 [Didymella exigua CBS 183.55]
MSSYSSAHSGQLHPGHQPQAQQQRARSYSNPPYPTTPGSAPYPQQQSSYFPPPPTAPYQQAPPTSHSVAIPPSSRKTASSDYAHGYGTSPSHSQASSSYTSSYLTQNLQPIPQPPPIPENYQYPPQHQQPITSSSPIYSHNRRRSSSSQGYDPRQSYESAHSYQSAQSYHGHPSPDYTRQTQNGDGNRDDRYNYGNEDEGHGQAHAAPEPPKGYGVWDKDEVAKYQKNRDLERRPTLGGSLMSFVQRIGGSDRR